MEGITVSDSGGNSSHRIALYSILCDQLHRYNTIFWQFPLALVTAHILALGNLRQDVPVLLAVVFFDGVLAYAFQMMVCHSRALVAATQEAEKSLRGEFDGFVPTFPKHAKVKATRLLVIAMWCVPVGLLIYGCFACVGACQQGATVAPTN